MQTGCEHRLFGVWARAPETDYSCIFQKKSYDIVRPRRGVYYFQSSRAGMATAAQDFCRAAAAKGARDAIPEEDTCATRPERTRRSRSTTDEEMMVSQYTNRARWRRKAALHTGVHPQTTCSEDHLEACIRLDSKLTFGPYPFPPSSLFFSSQLLLWGSSFSHRTDISWAPPLPSPAPSFRC